MLRRVARQRREFIYRKSLEGKEKAAYERKRKIKEAIEEGKPIPTELRNDAEELKAQAELDDAAHSEPTTHVDDEYARAGELDPKIVITTSRDPSSRLLQFSKELKLLFPNSQRMNRGNHVIKDIVDACRANEVTDIIIAHEHRGEPVGLVVCHLPFGPTAFFGLSNCVLRHDIAEKSTVSEAYPHLIFHNFTSSLGKRVMNILKYLFPVPKEDSKRVITFANTDDYISFRHHTYDKKGQKQVDLKEVGPRFEMKVYQIRLGTLDTPEAETEWALRPYMNTARKRQAL
eukprot:tig00020848_g14549.t1